MHWFPKIHKTPDRAKFVIASKNCSTKPLSGVISKVFKMLIKHVEHFHKKIILFSSYKNSWLWRILFQLLKSWISLKQEKRLNTFPLMILALCIPRYPIIC